MILTVCYRAEKETLWEFLSEVEDQLKKRKWKVIKLLPFHPGIANVLQLLLYPEPLLIYGLKYEYRWWAVVEGRAKKSEIVEGMLNPPPSWTIRKGEEANIGLLYPRNK